MPDETTERRTYEYPPTKLRAFGQDWTHGALPLAIQQHYETVDTDAETGVAGEPYWVVNASTVGEWVDVIVAHAPMAAPAEERARDAVLTLGVVDGDVLDRSTPLVDVGDVIVEVRAA